VAAAHRALPGSTLNIVPNGPHSLYWEIPEVFNSVLHGFLNTIYGEA
jgi:pimeloyl-ACP methyl ester carboxylesterase